MNTITITKNYIPDVGSSNIVVQNEQEYLIVNQLGSIYAIDNLCPHKLASLGLGEIVGDEVICPLHEYRFNFKSGLCNIERFHTKRYTVIISE